MARAVPMRVVWGWRDAIKKGASVKDLALASGYSEKVVRDYTKAERALVKEQKQIARDRAYLEMYHRENKEGNTGI